MARWPSRNKIYKMLTRRRNMVKEKLQRIESMLENMQPSDEEAKETTVGGDAIHQPAASQMETDPGKIMPSPQPAASQVETDPGKTMPCPQPAASQTETDPGKAMPRKPNTDREWEIIADSQ